MPLLMTALLSVLIISTSTSSATYADLATAALKRTKEEVRYDPKYVTLKYPMGDVPADTGVCSDVVIRSYRALGIDLQQLVHEDMKKNFESYPKLWGLKGPNTSIDHRRVPNLRQFFKGHGASLKVTLTPENYLPGDVVTWNLRNKSGSLPHIGIVSNLKGADKKRPLIIHNIGLGPQAEDILFDYDITGHYRYGLHPE